MMVSMPVFWYWLLPASSITALGHFLPRQLGLRCRLKCDSSICIPTLRTAPRLHSYSVAHLSSISSPTLRCSSHSSTHGIVYPALPGCDSSIEILHCLHMIRQVQWCHYGFNVSAGLPHSAPHTIQIWPFGSVLKTFSPFLFSFVTDNVCLKKWICCWVYWHREGYY